MSTLFSQLFTIIVKALPRMFLLGAPLLMAAVTIAALIDTRIPGKVKRDLAG